MSIFTHYSQIDSAVELNSTWVEILMSWGLFFGLLSECIADNGNSNIPKRSL
ncbi:hypothetical protein MHYP_G00238060 [Metynnis hypsauchen]